MPNSNINSKLDLTPLKAPSQDYPLTPIDRARLNPTSRKLAIYAECFDCMGCGADEGWRKAIGECHIVNCQLWRFRPYQHHTEKEKS